MTRVEWPDPRSYGGATDDPLVALAAAERGARSGLTARLRELSRAGDDKAIAAAFAAAPSQKVRLDLLEALKAAIDDPGPEEGDALLARVFALPLVFVVGGVPGAVLPGRVPDADVISGLLRANGALGQTENFGLSPALVTAEALDGVAPSVLFRWARSIGDANVEGRGLPGSEILVAGVDEQAHLRFLLGAGVAPAQAPSVVESASRIGAWGMPVTRALAHQLGQEGLSLLPLPRPPKSLLTAIPAGRFALEETRLNLFLSRVLRQLRASVGEPVAVLSVHAGGEIRLGLSSVFDASVLHGFRWRLGVFDDLDEVAATILSLLRDCRILDVRIVPGLQPAGDGERAARVLSIHDLGPSGEVRH
ncbi:MAG: hypothetical protein JNK68_16365 [Betaproteobacteria bacterium]|nr:hypothetical protein [Betaproteobacteria bacterium]